VQGEGTDTIQVLGARAEGCLLGALVGDAVGSLTEGLSYEEIGERFGWVHDPVEEASGSDDSYLMNMVARVLVATQGQARCRDWGHEWARHAAGILNSAFREKFFISILHTMYKLQLGMDPEVVATGNLPSSTAAMAIAPVGIVNAGNSVAAARQAWELASLVHPPEMAFCREAAAAVAAIIAELMDADHDIVSGIENGLRSVWCSRKDGDLATDIGRAIGLAHASSGFTEFRERYRGLFRRDVQCDSRETVPAAVALAVLAEGRVEEAVTWAANFGRDTDTIGAITGAICGAFQGRAGVPTVWVDAIDRGLAQEEARLAAELVAVRMVKANQEVSRWARCR
jgi:ADP-ribosylglycohydrolase